MSSMLTATFPDQHLLPEKEPPMPSSSFLYLSVGTRLTSGPESTGHAPPYDHKH